MTKDRAVLETRLIVSLVFASWLACACAAEDWVLTGLASIDAVSQAFLYEPCSGRSLTMRVGQEKAGCTLLGMDMQQGQVWLQRGTNPIVLRFSVTSETKGDPPALVARSSPAFDRSSGTPARARTDAPRPSALESGMALTEPSDGTAHSALTTQNTSPVPGLPRASTESPNAPDPETVAGSADWSRLDDPSSRLLRELLDTAAPTVGSLSGSPEEIAQLRQLLRTQSTPAVRERIQDQLHAYAAVASPPSAMAWAP
jgi:hypothetical protein